MTLIIQQVIHRQGVTKKIHTKKCLRKNHNHKGFTPSTKIASWVICISSNKSIDILSLTVFIKKPYLILFETPCYCNGRGNSI